MDSKKEREQKRERKEEGRENKRQGEKGRERRAWSTHTAIVSMRMIWPGGGGERREGKGGVRGGGNEAKEGRGRYGEEEERRPKKGRLGLTLSAKGFP